MIFGFSLFLRPDLCLGKGSRSVQGQGEEIERPTQVHTRPLPCPKCTPQSPPSSSFSTPPNPSSQMAAHRRSLRGELPPWVPRIDLGSTAGGCPAQRRRHAVLARWWRQPGTCARGVSEDDARGESGIICSWSMACAPVVQIHGPQWQGVEHA